MPIVGLGASAGGIQALAEFFGAMPVDTGMAFVVVLHLDPTKESQLSLVLSNHTSMPVLEIEDNMPVLPNQVYVIAPNRDLELEGNILRLRIPQQPRGHRHPVDVLFRSLAAQRAERCVAIILSGSGTNGSQGLRDIKGAGGLVLIQDPVSAQFDGMPRSAIGAGLADHVLVPGEMPRALLRFLQHDYSRAPDGPADQSEESRRSGLEQILAVLRNRSSLEFRNYKPATLIRRINRRMSLKNLVRSEDYLEILQTDPDEVRALVQDMLINVTEFFRDAEAWQTLGDKAIQQLVNERGTGAAIRIWVPACASGEEAYSLAMLFTEYAEAANKKFDLKVFASDLLEENLNIARAGIYPGASVEMLQPERIRRFFEKIDGSYQIRKTLRDVVIFARHDLLRDPPFSRMDLITCRNMLIYVEPEAQARVLKLFHFALRENGCLFLGSAETIGRADEFFETVSKKWRIYRRQGPTRHDILNFPLLGGQSETLDRPAGLVSSEPSGRTTEAARRVLLDRYAPASVLIDQKGRVLYFHGETSDFLKQPTGEPTRDLLAMARAGLLTKLRSAILTAFDQNQEITFRAQIREAALSRSVRVRLTPVPNSQLASGLLLITFEPDSPGPAPAARELEAEACGEDSAALEGELRTTRAELQATIEQLESVNEELKASNEEAISINEELQSTNEELETSKEELQSFNEELHSINSQLQHKISELDETGSDLSNLLSATDTATIFLDTDLRIKWFSPATKQLIELVTSDIGRPISHFARKFDDAQLLENAETVLSTLIPIETEIRSHDDRWYIRRVQPYRTLDNRIAGLVVSFVNITDRRRASDATEEARIYAEAIVSTISQPLVVLDGDLRVQSANLAFYKLFDTTAEKTEGKRLYDSGNGEWRSDKLRELLEDVLPKNRQFENVEISFGPSGLGQRCLLLNAQRLVRKDGRVDLILMAMEDITARRLGIARQEMLVAEMNHRVKNVLATVQAVVTQTLRQSTSLENFTTAFVGRLHALAQAHNLLSNEEWVGADLGELVALTLAPYSEGSIKRISTRGPKLMITPQTGVALVMVLHELATNAAKYGSLSVPAGKLSVTWRRDGEGSADLVSIKWRETNGPKIQAPSRNGFGTRLIERSMAYELAGEARLEYREEGLHCDLVFPWTAAFGSADRTT